MWISKMKYKELVGRLNKLEEKVSKFSPYTAERLNECRDDINDIRRIMNNSKFGEITHMSFFEKQIFGYKTGREIDPSYTYIYKDFKEYKITGLYLSNPIFTVDENNNNLLHVKDKYTYDGENKKEVDMEFLIDLRNQTFIKTK